jgi:hypothetical protein
MPAYDLCSMIEEAQEISTNWQYHQELWQPPDLDVHLVETSQYGKPLETPIKIFIDSQPQKERPIRSSAAIERRRHQNRASQSAFRERRRKQVEELQQKLSQCVGYNQKIYYSVRELFEKLEALKKDLEGAVALGLPLLSPESFQSSRTNSVDGRLGNIEATLEVATSPVSNHRPTKEEEKEEHKECIDDS